MQEINVSGSNIAGGVEKAGELPVQPSIWTKVRNFFLQDLTLELTPKQEKVFQEVHDFWHQDVTFKGIKDFLFQEVKF